MNMCCSAVSAYLPSSVRNNPILFSGLASLVCAVASVICLTVGICAHLNVINDVNSVGLFVSGSLLFLGAILLLRKARALYMAKHLYQAQVSYIVPDIHGREKLDQFIDFAARYLQAMQYCKFTVDTDDGGVESLTNTYLVYKTIDNEVFSRCFGYDYRIFPDRFERDRAQRCLTKIYLGKEVWFSAIEKVRISRSAALEDAPDAAPA